MPKNTIIPIIFIILGIIPLFTNQEVKQVEPERIDTPSIQYSVEKVELLENSEQLKEPEKLIDMVVPVVQVEASSKKEEPKPSPKNDSDSKVPSMKFYHGKQWRTGQYLIDIVRKHPNGILFYDAFEKEFGTEVADTMAVSLMFENATMWEKTAGVCDEKYQIGGDYRNCNYANRNSAGIDYSIKQINSFYQLDRIKKLTNEVSCSFASKAASKNRNNKCNQEIEKWLIIPENNLKVALDIYREQGNFCSWYGYVNNFPNNKCK
jgi:hypothetical protein